MSKPRRSRNEQAADRLHSAAIHLLRSLRKVDEESGLTAPRMSALSVIVFGGPRTLGQLAATEQVKPPTMTRLVTALEEEGYLKRKPDPDDGRLTMICATPKGESVMAAGRSRRVKALAARLSTLTHAEVLELEKAATMISRVAALQNERKS
jgi:DNA-binding MarR family transcriptional regulator